MTTLTRFLTWLGFIPEPTADEPDAEPLDVDWLPCPNNDPTWLPLGTPVRIISLGRRCEQYSPLVAPVEFGYVEWYYLPEEQL